ncbi:hypothetical protein BLA29_008440 [Euroglyphus maynei]|uniref:Uncharacterized protein n=1 Tax=Euroglyphus maynei TaxID=6958 RepID=A0A1Y3BKM4_EURMA|nr:hypothetical protein BLA29_008440 [Euroglyphus maynei]
MWLILSAYCSSLPYISSSSSLSLPAPKTHRLRGPSSRTAYPTRAIPPRYYPLSNSSISSHQPSISSTSSLQQISSTKVHGAVDCIMAIHGEISWCNQSYYQSLTQVIVKGYRKESRVYRRQYCCGHWSLQRCIFTVMQRKCDQETYDKIRDARSMDWNANTQQINCDDYEHNSPVCSSTSAHRFSLITMIFSISTTIIILSSF